ncbi:zinc finger AN1 and C2H2 domain-containing stress-associated protein 16-like [Phalaenopsis equestris]|uniref:zinc finger AN1 and C2H2 domain-containing stress-associated protein 16-like n=1 Tax=Phalaenopsis equestris TaxID=78828 RepID=UPI0009E34F67|nr:zinc finger AN1 and C2H2 domain-containing stress-associated protein 16-like [Phalaenopsis equestris]
MGTPAFPNLGKHCSVEDCKLIDFLPFTCDRCDKVFCLQHRSYAKHTCPNANQTDVTVLICPLCAQSVRLVPNEDPNITWDLHVNGNCDPSNYQKTTKKKRCPVPGCKEILVFSNTIRCKDCTQEHCLRHRFGPDHNCVGPRKPDTGLLFLGGLRRNQNGNSKPNPTSNGSSKWSSSILNAASSIRASAEAGMQRLGIATNEALRKAKDGTGQGSSGSGDLVERCIRCEARFTNVAALIEHVEKAHPSRVIVDVCPRCSKAFRDPVLLVEHVEKDHGGFSKS